MVVVVVAAAGEQVVQVVRSTEIRPDPFGMLLGI